MTPRVRILLAGGMLLGVALFSLLALATAYWPFQSTVEVVSPFLGLSILSSVGLSLILTGFLLPRTSVGGRERSKTTSTIDSLMEEIRRSR
jgi:hypothetical protein